MIPQSQPKKAKNSSKVNLTISAVVHGVIILALIYFAAREGYLGKKIQKISVEMVKEKKPEPEKPKPEPPKVEPPKIEVPKEAPKYVEPKAAAPPTVAPPVVAPPSVDVPTFEFSGGKAVNSERATRCSFTRVTWNTRCARNGTGRKTWTTARLWRKWR